MGRLADRRGSVARQVSSFPAIPPSQTAHPIASEMGWDGFGQASILPTSGAVARRSSIGVLILSAAFSLHVDRARASGVSVHRSSADVAVSVVDQWSAMLAEASLRTGLPAVWLHDLMRAESGGNALAVSPKGAVGLMQVMPATYAALRDPLGLGADPFLPRDNILAGAAYLRLLVDRYGWPGALAAYNAGPARLDAFLTRGRALPAETVAYLWRVASMHGPSAATTAAARAFGSVATTSNAWRDKQPAASMPTLFVGFASTSSVRSAADPPADPSRGAEPTTWRKSGLFVSASGVPGQP